MAIIAFFAILYILGYLDGLTGGAISYAMDRLDFEVEEERLKKKFEEEESPV
jgi:hypothetical protein